PEGLGGLLPRQFESRRGRIENLLAARPEFMGGRPMNHGAVVREIRVECSAHGAKRVRPRFLDRRSNVAAPEASHMLESPDDVVPANYSVQEHVKGQGGGSDVAVPEDEPAEQSSMRTIGGVLEITVAVYQEQEHVSISKVGAGWN